MVTFTEDNLLTVFHRDLENTYGKTTVHSKVISSKVSEMVMDFGRQIMIEWRPIKVTMQWIRNQDTEFMFGIMDGLIRVTLKVTIVMGMESSMMVGIG